MEDGVYQTELHSFLDGEIGKLPQRQADVIRRRYWFGNILQEIAGESQRSVQNIAAHERQAIQSLRRQSGKRIAAYLDEQTDYFHCGGAGCPRPVEATVQRRDELLKRLTG